MNHFMFCIHNLRILEGSTLEIKSETSQCCQIFSQVDIGASYQSWQCLVMAGVNPSQIKTTQRQALGSALLIALALALHVFSKEGFSSTPLNFLPLPFDQFKSSIKIPPATIFLSQSLLLKKSPLTKSLLIVLLLPRGSSGVSGRRPRSRININFHQAPAGSVPPLPLQAPLLSRHLPNSKPQSLLPLTRMALAHISKIEAEKKKGKGSKRGDNWSSPESSTDRASESDEGSESKSESESESGNESDGDAESEKVSESESDSDWSENVESESAEKYESDFESDSESEQKSKSFQDSDEKNASEYEEFGSSSWESEYETSQDKQQYDSGSTDWRAVSTEAGKMDSGSSPLRMAHVSDSDESDESDPSFESVAMNGEAVDEDYVEATFETSVSMRSKNWNMFR